MDELLHSYTFDSPVGYYSFIAGLRVSEIEFNENLANFEVTLHENNMYPDAIYGRYSVDSYYEYLKNKYKKRYLQDALRAIFNNELFWPAIKATIAVLILVGVARVGPGAVSIVYESVSSGLDKQFTSVVDSFNASLGDAIVDAVDKVTPDISGSVDKITEAIIDEITLPELPKITLPEITLPKLPEITLPDLNPFNNGD